MANVLSREEFVALYAPIASYGSNLHLRNAFIPKELWPLIPYAEFWGHRDDSERFEAISRASEPTLQNLRDVVFENDQHFDQWLAGREAESPPFSPEYIGFTCLRMAAMEADVILLRRDPQDVWLPAKQ